MSKYIIDVGEGYIRHGLERTLTIPVRINEHEDHWMDTRIPLTPYTEPDTDEDYQRGLNDANEGKATCQYCEYQYLDDTEEPCKKCCKAYLNKFKPKAKEEQIQVGDEVIRHYKNEFAEGDDAPSIFLYEEYGHFRCLAFDGRSIMIVEYPKNQYRKTGRHFPEIAAVLAKMKEES